MGTLEQIRLLVLGAQPTQRRFRNAEIICNPLNAGPAGHRHGLAFELIRETPLFGDGSPLLWGKSTKNPTGRAESTIAFFRSRREWGIYVKAFRLL
jgi:hypothetical protein